MSKLQKQSPAWHAEAVELLRQNFEKIHLGFVDATKRGVWLGLFINHIKAMGKADDSIPHGEFKPWLKRVLPDLSYRQASFYMTMGRGIIERTKIQICGNRTFATLGNLPPEVEKLIEGKTQNQLFLEFKQAEEDGEDGYKTKVGRRKGEGGKPAEPRGTIEEIIAFRAKAARRHLGRSADELEKLGIDFMGLEDTFNQIFLGELDRTAKCLRQWLNTPPEKRDMTAIQKLWNSL